MKNDIFYVGYMYITKSFNIPFINEKLVIYPHWTMIC